MVSTVAARAPNAAPITGWHPQVRAGVDLVEPAIRAQARAARHTGIPLRTGATGDSYWETKISSMPCRMLGSNDLLSR
jgi:hypothetical protein